MNYYRKYNRADSTIVKKRRSLLTYLISLSYCFIQGVVLVLLSIFTTRSWIQISNETCKNTFKVENVLNSWKMKLKCLVWIDQGAVSDTIHIFQVRIQHFINLIIWIQRKGCWESVQRFIAISFRHSRLSGSWNLKTTISQPGIYSFYSS